MDHFPEAGMELTTILVVSDIKRASAFYTEVLGADLIREYGGTSCVLKLMGSWLLLVTGGGPTEDKPTVTFNTPANPNRVDHSFTIRVPSCRESFEVLKSRGAVFLTAPVEYEHEVRCFFRDPDGHLFELSESR